MSEVVHSEVVHSEVTWSEVVVDFWHMRVELSDKRRSNSS